MHLGVASSSLHDEPEELLQEDLLPPIVPALEAPELMLSIAHEDVYAIEAEAPAIHDQQQILSQRSAKASPAKQSPAKPQSAAQSQRSSPYKHHQIAAPDNELGSIEEEKEPVSSLIANNHIRAKNIGYTLSYRKGNFPRNVPINLTLIYLNLSLLI